MNDVDRKVNNESKCSIESELDRLWERYDDTWSTSEREEIRKQIKELENKL